MRIYRPCDIPIGEKVEVNANTLAGLLARVDPGGFMAADLGICVTYDADDRPHLVATGS